MCYVKIYDKDGGYHEDMGWCLTSLPHEERPGRLGETIKQMGLDLESLTSKDKVTGTDDYPVVSVLDCEYDWVKMDWEECGNPELEFEEGEECDPAYDHQGEEPRPEQWESDFILIDNVWYGCDNGVFVDTSGSKKHKEVTEVYKWGDGEDNLFFEKNIRKPLSEYDKLLLYSSGFSHSIGDQFLDAVLGECG